LTFNGMVDACSDDGYPQQRGAYEDQHGCINRRVPEASVERFLVAGGCPPYAVAVWAGAPYNDNGDYVSQCGQSIVYGCQKNFAVNSEIYVPSGKIGFGQVGPWYKVLYDASDPPSLGDHIGPVPSQWPCVKGAGGFVVYGILDATNHIALCRSEPQYWYFAKNNGSAILVGNSASMDVYKLTDTVSLVASGYSFSVRAFFGGIAAGAVCMIQTLGTANAAWFAVETNKCP
jgi:hypothetical protein